MRILFFGNQDNLGFELCSWCREFGVEGEVYSFDHDLPRSQPELVDPSVAGRYPDWFHLHSSVVPHVPVVRRALSARLEREFDVLVVSGTRGLLASRAIRRLPKVMYAIGGDVAEAPFAFEARWRGIVAAAFRVMRAPFARAAIRDMDVIIENYETNLNALKRLGLMDRRVCLGMPENARGCRSLVDPHLRKVLIARYGRCRRLFLWLTRLNFLDPNDAAYKGAERFLQALEAVRPGLERGEIRVVVGNHGHDAAEFRRLAEARGLSGYLDWVPHLPFPQMLTYVSLPNAVVFGKFGEFLGMPAAIDRDCMVMGAALVSTVDPAYAAQIYGARPPVLDAVTAADVARRMVEVAAMDEASFQALQASMRAFGDAYIDYHAIVPRFLELLERTRDGGRERKRAA